MDCPITVEAVPVGEYNSVPVDVIELDNQFDPTALILKKGNYRIRIRIMNKDREIEISEIEVK